MKGLEEKVRRVRTPEGARVYGQPIGTVIKPDIAPDLPVSRGPQSGTIPYHWRHQGPWDPHRPRPVLIDRRALKDYNRLQPRDQKRVREAIRALESGTATVRPKVRGALAGTYGVDLSGEGRMLVYPHVDGTWHIYALLPHHDYREAERRMERVAGGAGEEGVVGVLERAVQAPATQPAISTRPLSAAFWKRYRASRDALPDDSSTWFDLEKITAFDKDWRRANDGPGPRALEREAQIRAVGKVLDDEVQRRLKAAGVRRPLSDKEMARLREERTRLYDAYNEEKWRYMEDTARRMFGPPQELSERWPELSPDEVRRVIDQIHADHPHLAPMRDRTDELLMQLVDPGEKAYATAYADALHAVLSEIRPMGGDLKGDADIWPRPGEMDRLRADMDELGVPEGSRQEFVRRYGQKLNTQARATLDFAASRYPTSWIEASNTGGRTFKIIRAEDGRGYYRHWGGPVDPLLLREDLPPDLLALGNDLNSRSVGIHELAHRMEKLFPTLTAAEWTFHWRRTGRVELGGAISSLDPETGEWLPDPWEGKPVYVGNREAVEQLGELAPGAGYRADERARKDRYTNPYIGKDYSDGPFSSYEVLSMGVEGVWTGSVEMWKDAEHRNLVLGLLAAA